MRQLLTEFQAVQGDQPDEDNSWRNVAGDPEVAISPMTVNFLDH